MSRCAIFIMTILISCSSFAAEIYSKTLKREDLMNIVFPEWKASLNNTVTLIVPSEEKNQGTTRQTETNSPSEFEITPLYVVRLDDSNAVLITTAILPICGYSCERFIGTYFFTLDSQGWRITKRIDTAASLNYGGESRVEKWPGHGFVFSQVEGGCWQGACTDNVIFLGLQPGKVLHLLSTSVMEDNSAQSIYAETKDEIESNYACGDLLDDKFVLPAGVEISADTECREAIGKWRFEGDFMKFHFEGTKRRVNEKGRLGPIKNWKLDITLKLQDDQLVPVNGKLPKFGF